ncbi:uncharacterized protein LOC142332819 [Lycorma delicatula]|uniref:uncharacterized protein LOC142332819 n=1 Tax=Lycorma delicatula TaxID=130591 RepID=UPI003F514DB5
MAASYLLFGLFFVVCLNNVHSNLFLTDFELPSAQIDKCNKGCNENYKSSNDVLIPAAITTESGSCARGCRFFSIAKMFTENSGDTSIALNACYQCCDDSYLDSKRKSCRNGCDSMSLFTAEPAFVRSSFSLSIFIADDSDDQGVQSTGDIEPDDVLTDPALRNQLSLNVIDDKKLPEMKIKTLPVENDQLDNSINSNEKVALSSTLTSPSSTSSSECLWWIRDFLQLNHVPPCLLAAVLVLIIILLLRFLFTCDTRRNLVHRSSPSFNDDMNASLTKSIFSSPGKSMPIAVLVDPIDKTDKNQMEVIVPTIHKIPPPKYDDAVMNDDESLMIKNTSSPQSSSNIA